MRSNCEFLFTDLLNVLDHISWKSAGNSGLEEEVGRKITLSSKSRTFSKVTNKKHLACLDLEAHQAPKVFHLQPCLLLLQVLKFPEQSEKPH